MGQIPSIIIIIIIEEEEAAAVTRAMNSYIAS